MADVKISALPASTVPLAGTEVLPIVQGATTKQVTIANVTAGRAVSAASLDLTTSPLPLASGGTGKTSAPAAMANLIGFTTTVTSATPVALTNTSSYYQVFTGSTAQIITLPVVSTLIQGWSFHIANNSSEVITVNSSASNLVLAIPAGVTAMYTCILITGTTAASWEAGLTDFSTVTGTGAVVLATSPTFVTPALGTPASGVVTNLTGTASININGTVGATTANTGVFTTVKAATTVGVGAATPSASGSGVTFPATQSASSDANTLDDYEEGTFTPTVIGEVAGTATYSTQVGKYTKIGNVVNILIDLTWTGGTGSGAFLAVTGLPFTIGGSNIALVGFTSDVTLSALNIPIFLANISTNIIYIQQTPTGGGARSNINYDAAGSATIGGIYFI